MPSSFEASNIVFSADLILIYVQEFGLGILIWDQGQLFQLGWAMEETRICHAGMLRSVLSILQWWAFNVTVIIMNKWIFQVLLFFSPNFYDSLTMYFLLPPFILFNLLFFQVDCICCSYLCVQFDLQQRGIDIFSIIWFQLLVACESEFTLYDDDDDDLFNSLNLGRSVMTRVNRTL